MVIKRDVSLPEVAGHAGCDEVRQLVCTPVCHWLDVVDMEKYVGRLCAAVLALEGVTLEHLEAQGLRYWLSGRRRARHG